MLNLGVVAGKRRRRASTQRESRKGTQVAKRGANEGSIYKRSDGYWVGAMSDGPGHRKVIYAKTRGEVAEKMKALLRAQQQGVPIATGRPLTVGAFLERWLAGAKSSVRGSTFTRYSQLVRVHLIPRLGKIPLPKLIPADLSAAYASMLSDGLAPRTAGHAHRVLGRALREAEVAGLIGRNVARLVKPPRVPHAEMHTFSAEQARALLHASADDRLGALYAVALATGARQGELLALRWPDVDFDNGAVRIRRTLVRTGGRHELGEPKTASSRRSIPIGAATIDALRAHRRAQAQERLRIGGVWQDGDLVFPSVVGTPLDGGNLLKNSYYPLLARVGLPRLPFHNLRHTAATLLLAAGTHPKIVAERLGHSTPTVTLNVYSHVTPTMQREAAATLDRVLGA